MVYFAIKTMVSSYFAVILMVVDTICACSPCGDTTKNTIPKQVARQGFNNFDAPDTINNGDNGRRKKKCCPYDFNSKLCQVVNDRMLCGFNKNVGKPEDNNAVYSLSDGCRLRAGRLECGYEQPPYINIRRPPARNLDSAQEFSPELLLDNDSEAKNYDYGDVNKFKLKQPLTNNFDKSKLNMSNGHLEKNEKKPTGTKCVEINERIVCKS